MSTSQDFEIMEKLGEGAFASVYKVRRKSDGKIYAMKKVNMQKLSEREKINAVNEIRILASIQDPNIIGYKEAFFDNISKQLCIIQNYASGGDLLKQIQKAAKSQRYFDEEIIWKYAIQMTQGLKTLHNMKILHRDLKSANIFLDNKGCLLGDLNVSKITSNNLAVTQTGTPYYAGPEVWKNKPYSNKVDIWSLGCIIYEMATLRPPFRANDYESLFRKINRGVYDPIPSRYSKDLSELVRLCLLQSATNRPGCDELLQLSFIKFRINNQDLQTKQELQHNNLMETIKIPKNLAQLKLPKASYKENTQNNSFNGFSYTPQIQNRKQNAHHSIDQKKDTIRTNSNNSRILQPLNDQLSRGRNYSVQINEGKTNQIVKIPSIPRAMKILESIDKENISIINNSGYHKKSNQNDKKYYNFNNHPSYKDKTNDVKMLR